jgi:hypothetical protein
MKISRGMIDHYLRFITDGWFDAEDVPATDVTAYQELAKDIERSARRRNDIEPLLAGFDYLLAHPEISLEGHGNIYGWDDDEVRVIIRYLLSIIKPSPMSSKSDMSEVTLVPMSREAWWDMRKAQGLHPAELKQ